MNYFSTVTAPILFLLPKKSVGFCARDLKPNMKIKIGRKIATVSSIAALDGSNGEPMLMIGGARPSAVAIKIEFVDHETLVAHPADPLRRAG